MISTEKFLKIAGLELDCQNAKDTRAKVGTYTSHAHKMDMNRAIVEAQDALFAELNKLTTDELAAYGEYRASMRTA